MKKFILIPLFIVLITSAFGQKSKNSSKYIDVYFYLFVDNSGANDGYYFIIINKTDKDLELIFECSQFIDTVTVNPGYNFTQVANNALFYIPDMQIEITGRKPHFKMLTSSTPKPRLD